MGTGRWLVVYVTAMRGCYPSHLQVRILAALGMGDERLCLRSALHHHWLKKVNYRDGYMLLIHLQKRFYISVHARQGLSLVAVTVLRWPYWLLFKYLTNSSAVLKPHASLIRYFARGMASELSAEDIGRLVAI